MTNATFDPFVGTLTTNNMPSCTSQRLRIFSTMKNKNNYMMGHTPLQVVEKERDLGVVVSASNTLCWMEQIRGMIGKAKQMTSWIIRNVVSRKPEVPIPFYKAFVRPQLEYAVQVWAPTARHGNWGVKMEIEDCQRQFTRIIKGMGPLTASQINDFTGTSKAS